MILEIVPSCVKIPEKFFEMTESLVEIAVRVPKREENIDLRYEETRVIEARKAREKSLPTEKAELRAQLPRSMNEFRRVLELLMTKEPEAFKKEFHTFEKVEEIVKDPVKALMKALTLFPKRET